MCDCWWVVGGKCRETKEMFIVISDVRDKESLGKIIFDHVRSGSRIFTDGWKGYNGLRLMGLQYTHQTVNHSQHFVNPNDRNVHTNTIERAWRNLRESIPLQTRKCDIESHIETFLFFHNNATPEKTPFDLLLDLYKVTG